MALDEVLTRVLELLQRQGWVSYRTLKRRFGLDENTFAALRAELIEVRQLAVEEEGTRLVWTGALIPQVSTQEHKPVLPVSPTAPQPAASTVALMGEGSSRLTPLVGREQEVALLLERWAQVQTGQGQVVVLSGEAGIGKSRLVKELKERVAQELHVCWECRCAPYYQNSALYPVIDLFQRALQFEPGDGPQEKLHKLEEALALYNLSLPEVVPLFASLLSVPLNGHYPPLTLTPERQKQKTLEAVLSVVGVVGAQQGVLMIVEDLQWVDPSTLELLTLFVEQAPTVRLYLLLTCRPEFRAPWARPSHLTSLTLTRMLPEQVEAMAERVAGGKGLPPEVCQQLVVKTEGVPLFVEELAKIVLELGLLQEREDHYELAGPLPPLALPSTLHDSLLARLEGLGEAQVVAQVGSVWGRGFTETQLRAVVPLGVRQLEQAVRRLVVAELIQEVSLPPRVTYIFKHALIQDVAYSSMPLEMRREYHGRVAQVLEERFPETVETQPELLAHHYTEAGFSAQAILYWQRAGQRAIARSANIEALRHLGMGLELLKTLPETPERLQQELGLQMTLGIPLMTVKGYAAPEVEQAYTRARTLCQRIGATPQLAPVLWGLCAFHEVRGELSIGQELAEQALHVIQDSQDPVLRGQAHHALGTNLLYRGEFAAAQTQWDLSISCYDRLQHPTHVLMYGQDSGIASHAYASWTLWILGYPDQARQRSHEGLALTQNTVHFQSAAYALTCTAVLHGWLQEWPSLQTQAERILNLATEQGLALWIALGAVGLGWSLEAQGHHDAGLAQLRQGIAAYQATGAQLIRSWQLCIQAQACLQAGYIEDGLQIIAGALAHIERTEERWYEAEVWRVKGELTLAGARGWGLGTGPSSLQAPSPKPLIPWEKEREAEEYFLKAINVARRQQAKSWELRATTSLARMWQQQGKQEEARQRLEEVYKWFTEGFDTADLQEAKTLLTALSRNERQNPK